MDDRRKDGWPEMETIVRLSAIEPDPVEKQEIRISKSDLSHRSFNEGGNKFENQMSQTFNLGRC
jgi:hypothetical protein